MLPTSAVLLALLGCRSHGSGLPIPRCDPLQPEGEVQLGTWLSGRAQQRSAAFQLGAGHLFYEVRADCSFVVFSALDGGDGGWSRIRRGVLDPGEFSALAGDLVERVERAGDPEKYAHTIPFDAPTRQYYGQSWEWTCVECDSELTNAEDPQLRSLLLANSEPLSDPESFRILAYEATPPFRDRLDLNGGFVLSWPYSWPLDEAVGGMDSGRTIDEGDFGSSYLTWDDFLDFRASSYGQDGIAVEWQGVVFEVYFRDFVSLDGAAGDR